jgi:environmental stress-induced protein Ves
MTAEILRAADRPATSWRNGGGITHEVARGPAGPEGGDFDWRISIAEVGAPGPFSAYQGVRRTIALIDGAALTLIIDGERHELGLYQPLTFDGASVTSCELPAGPTRDLNVMTTLGQADAAIEIRRLTSAEPSPVDSADPLVLIALAGSLTVTAGSGGPVGLAALDALRWAGPGSATVCGPGVVAVVSVTSAVTTVTAQNRRPDPHAAAETS